MITKEDFPRVLIERGKNLKSIYLETFGPYTNSTQLKQALKIIRKIFPFRDKCLPVETLVKAGQPNSCRPCFNYQIGLCPGVCAGLISKKDYLKIIRNIKLFFQGKKKQIIKNLEKEMKSFAKTGEYEKAGQIRNKIFALNHIQDVALIKDEYNRPVHQNVHPALTKVGKGRSNEVGSAFSSLVKEEWRGLASRGGVRIEAYDVAHLSGTNNVGVMVVMENGPASPSGAGWEFKKSDYRKFIIRHSKGNDIVALKEILERRLKHTEWSRPDLMVVDGGLAQLNTARKESTAPNPSSSDEGKRKVISVVAVTKNNKHKPKAIIGDENIIKKYKKEILLINNEAHRFAITFHRQKRNVIL